MPRGSGLQAPAIRYWASEEKQRHLKGMKETGLSRAGPVLWAALRALITLSMVSM